MSLALIGDKNKYGSLSLPSVLTVVVNVSKTKSVSSLRFNFLESSPIN